MKSPKTLTLSNAAQVSFWAPKKVKTAFQKAVISNETDMTAVLVALMADYAVKHGEVINAD